MNRMDAYVEPVSAARDSSPAPATASEQRAEVGSLWQAYAVSRDQSVRNRLLIHYLPLSRTIARHLHGRMPTRVDLDDLAQAAILGLRAAIDTYDPNRGVAFEHYCGPRVRGAVLDHLRSLDWAPRMHRSRLQRVRDMAQQIEMETGSTATDEEVSTALDMPLDELRELRHDAGAANHLRISFGDEPAPNAVNLETLADEGTLDPLREAQRADLREFFTKGLSAIERQVLMLYYYDNLNLREIGESLKLCESRVSQIHHAVLQRLRERIDRIGGCHIDD